MILEDYQAKKVDELLRDNWDISLSRFAQILATCAGDWLQRPEMINITKAKLKRHKIQLLGLKTYIFKRLREIESFNFYPNKHLTEEELIKYCELKDFFDKYFNPLFARIISQERAHKPSQGAHITKKSILAASWGNLISQHGKKMNWTLLADLYEWFWKRLCSFPFYRCIEPPGDLVNYLSVQYHRHKTNPDSNYCVEAFGQRDFITIFASKGSFVDRNFAYTDHILMNIQGNRASPQSFSWEHELIFEGNDISDYLRFTTSLYSKLGITNICRYPLIIFPDKSWYSLDF